jgi:tetratricopeptide (TPR) repeat protein
MTNYLLLDDTLAVGWLYVDMGNLYFKNNFFDDAERNYLKALQLFKDIKLLTGQATVYNNMALIQIELGYFNLAINNYQKALVLRQNNSDSALVAHSYLYIGELYLIQNHIIEAKEYFEKALEIGLLKDTLNLVGISYQFLGETYAALGNDSLCTYYFSTSEAEFKVNENANYLIDLYNTKADIYKKNGNFLKAKKSFLKSLNIAKKQNSLIQQVEIYEQLLSLIPKLEPLDDSLEIKWYNKLSKVYGILYKAEVGRNLMMIEMRDELIQYKIKIEIKEAEVSKAKILRNALIIIAFLSILVFVVLYIRYREKRSKDVIIAEQKELFFAQQMYVEEVKTKRVKIQLDAEQRELVMKATFLQQQNELISSFKKELKYQISLLDDDKVKGLKSLLTTMNKTMKAEDILQDFESHFIDVHPGFLEALSKKYPKLSAKDLRMCAYHKMNLDTKEIARISSVTVRSVQTSRYRLRIKFNIPKEMSLIAFFNA